ncbi:MAG: V-type ATP synthase subunit F [Candidatus Aminicenantes bacterium]|nr:V-type ATP synthase subunit F [Candidatus Aminicenantes bacterium]MDH5386216.1 V-type ATP synthase subunit F [Candidatus Aminicenantes bacterium]
MLEKLSKVAVIGDQDLVFPLRVLGIKVFAPQSVEEARRILKDLERENVALCFLHQSLLEPLQVEREALRKKIVPVVVGFSDYRKVIDHLDKMMKEMAVKATGSDALVKRRGNHGTR